MTTHNFGIDWLDDHHHHQANEAPHFVDRPPQEPTEVGEDTSIWVTWTPLVCRWRLTTPFGPLSSRQLMTTIGPTQPPSVDFSGSVSRTKIVPAVTPVTCISSWSGLLFNDSKENFSNLIREGSCIYLIVFCSGPLFLFGAFLPLKVSLFRALVPLRAIISLFRALVPLRATVSLFRALVPLRAIVSFEH
jgi:hypothetical protein